MPVQIEKVNAENPPHRRFYQVSEVAAMLATSKAQVYAIVRCGDLPAIKLGGRGQWRIEATEIDRWLAEKYAETSRFVSESGLFPSAGEAGEE